MSAVFFKLMGNVEVTVVLANSQDNTDFLSKRVTFLLLRKEGLEVKQITFKLSTKSVEIVCISVLMGG